MPSKSKSKTSKSKTSKSKTSKSKTSKSKTSTSKKRPLNGITLNNITVDKAYWRKRPNIVRTNGAAVKLPRKAYDAQALNKWIKMSKNQGQDAVFPDNRMPMSEKEMYAISLAATVPRAHRKEYRQYTYWRKRPNIGRPNIGRHKAYDARALNKWIKMSQKQGQDAIVFPDNMMPMSEKEMYAISLVATVPPAHRKEYRLLVTKRKQLDNSLKRLYKLEKEVEGVYSHNKKLEEIVEKTKKAIVWSDKKFYALLNDEFRLRFPKMYNKELRLLVTKRKKLDKDLILLYDAKFKLKEKYKEKYSDVWQSWKKLEEEVKETKKAIVSLDKSMNTLRRPIQTSSSDSTEQTPWNSPGGSHRSSSLRSTNSNN